MEALTGDVKYGVRSLIKDWRFTTMVLLTLAVCIAANTALFTIVNSVLLRPLPTPDANAILLMSNEYPKAGVGDTNFSSGADYYDRLREVHTFEEQAMFEFRSQTVNGSGPPERILGMAATPSLFRLLRALPAQGRSFTDDDGEIGREQKVILSHGLWQHLYGGDTAAIGRDIRLSGRPFTIIGVMPRGFLFVNPEVRFWIPLAFTAEQKTGRHSNNWYNVGRLKSGATLAQAQAAIDALNAANMERFPQWRTILNNAGFRTRVQPLQEFLIRDVKATLYLLWAGAAFVLLIGAVNIGNLALARTTLRMKEFGTRLALGASRAQIARQLITENVMIALAGGLAGLALGMAILRALGRIGLDRFPRAGEVQVDATVVIFALAVAVLAGIGVAIIPLAGIWKAGLIGALRENSRTASGRGTRLARQSLVVIQIGFAFVLLAGAGLLLASFWRLLRVDPGFRTEGVLTASTSAPAAQYADSAALRRLMSRSLAAIRRIPGVTLAGATSDIPFSSGYSDNVILAEGYVMKPGESIVSPLRLIATPGYMEAMNISLVRGRYFHEGDNETSPRVVIVDERLARKFWPDRDPIGRRLYFPSGIDVTRTDENTTWLKVVGVVRSVRLLNLAGTGNLAGAYYFPYAQTTPRNYTFAMRVSGEISAVARDLRAELANIDPALALFDVRTMAQRTELSLASRRASLSLAVAFGGLALFLSAVGIYGVLSYLLSLRRREVGIRLAVGSSPFGIFKLFLREGVVLVACGLLLGLAGSATLRKVVENQLYGVQPLDPRVVGTVVALLGGVALAACVWPARLAARIDPALVLNEQ